MRSAVAMTEPTNEPGPGIDQQAGAGVAENDLGTDDRPADGRGSGTLRTDPDQPEEAMREAEEASETPD